MNNELITKLTSLGTTLIDLLQNGIDLASKEVPIIVNEAMTYWTVMSVRRII